jgi:hypothetical protein
MTIKATLFTFVAVAMMTAAAAPSAYAQNDNPNRRTVLTFSQPFEVPGKVLPAGTYTFQLADTLNDRHIVSISSADGSEQLAMAMGIATNRVEATNRTVITFNEVPAGQPDTIRTWFYPGRNGGVEFVYPKRRAIELATTARVIVPAIAVDEPTPDLRTVPLVAITPTREEVPVAAVLQAIPVQQQAAAPAAPRQLPRTAGSLNLILLFGLIALCAGSAALYARTPRVAVAVAPTR